MKPFINRIFLVLSVLLAVFLSFPIISAYMANHTYYYDMLSLSNFKLVIWAVVYALIVLSYMLFANKKTIVWFLGFLFWWLFLFALTMINIKDSEWIIWSWLIMLLLNIAILFVFWIYFIVGLLWVWTYIKSKLLKLQDTNILDIFINFGIWLALFNILNYVLIMTNTFYSFISWIIFLWFWAVIYFQKDKLNSFWDKFSEILDFLHYKKIMKNKFLIIPAVLVVMSILYYFFGFMHSYIPYPTAWDANHAYMFYPKMFAYNSWFYWNEIWMWWGIDLWSSYIAFWFNLFTPIENGFWISPDTLAVEMNFLSWVFVLFFWLALIKEVLEFLSKDNRNSDIVFYLWWFLLIAWLSSWMWAFLVFVDNKTDLWIMTMSTLAIYSWFMFIKKISEHWEQKIAKSDFSYLIMSGFLFAMAVLAKPTALFDVLSFSMFLSWIWVWPFLAVSFFVILVWLLWLVKFKWMSDYVSVEMWKYILWSWLLLALIDLWKSFIKKSLRYIAYIIVFGLTFLLTVTIIRAPYLVYSKIKSNQPIEPAKFIQSILLWKVSSDSDNKLSLDNKVLLVSTNVEQLLSMSWEQSWSQVEDVSINACKLDNYKTDDVKSLYKDLKEWAWDGFSEDVGRYVWYWWRKIQSPFWKWILWWDGCKWFDDAAVEICNNESKIDSWNFKDLKSLLSKLDKNSKWYELLSKIYEKKWFDENSNSKDNLALISDEINSLKQYYQDYVIKVTWEDVYIPYRYVVPFNVTFNWSLQNLSSYYTDIWFVWLLSIFIILMWFVYSIFKLNKQLMWISLITLFSWLLWSIIWWWILWYNIWIIIWTIIALVAYVYAISNTENKIDRLIWYVFVWFLWVLLFAQVTMNFARIATQWWSWPFIWYKQSNWKVTEFTWLQLQPTSVLKKPYVWKDIFELQFPHYNKFLDLVNNRKEDEWIFLAWTYARYFIKNQSHIVSDQFLNWLYKEFSDGDACASYLRLKNDKIKYIAIDPNIWTVVMWWWNKSLFDRFFAKINDISGRIDQHGSVSMLTKLYENGYLNYISSNNIWAKYAFTMSDDELSNAIWKQLTKDDLTVIRASMSIARYPNIQSLTQKYFDNNTQWIVLFVLSLMDQRVSNWQFVYDIADMYGKKVDANKFDKILSKLLTTWNIWQEVISDISKLTSEEKFVFVQYLNIYYLKSKAPSDYSQALQKALVDSIWASSQIVVLEVK